MLVDSRSQRNRFHEFLYGHQIVEGLERSSLEFALNP